MASPITVTIKYEYLGRIFVRNENGTCYEDELGGIYRTPINPYKSRGNFQPHWYEGYEYCDYYDVDDRVKELSEITNEKGQKKYRNIKVV